MAEALFGVSQTSLLRHTKPKIRFSITRSGAAPTLFKASFGSSSASNLLRAHHQKQLCAAVASDPKSSNTFIVDSETKEVVNIEPDTGGGSGNGFGDRGGNGGGGGGGGGGGDNRNEGEGEGESHEKSKKMGLSMSQKLTLGYAALVGGQKLLTLSYFIFIN